MVALPCGAARQLGRVAALAAGALLAFGADLPVLQPLRPRGHLHRVHHARVARRRFRFLDRPRAPQPALIGALLALSFATKESTFITVFVAGTFFLALASDPEQRRRRCSRAVTASAGRLGVGARRVRARLHDALHHLPHPPERLWDGIHDGLDYWLGQQHVGRGGEPLGFYVVVLFGEEWPVLLLGASARRRAPAPDAAARCS